MFAARHQFPAYSYPSVLSYCGRVRFRWGHYTAFKNDERTSTPAKSLPVWGSFMLLQCIGCFGLERSLMSSCFREEGSSSFSGSSEAPSVVLSEERTMAGEKELCLYTQEWRLLAARASENDYSEFLLPALQLWNFLNLVSFLKPQLFQSCYCRTAAPGLVSELHVSPFPPTTERCKRQINPNSS